VFTALFTLGTHIHSLYSLLLLATALAAAILGVRVVVRERWSVIGWWFLAPSMMMAIWLLCRSMTASATVEMSAVAWARAAYLTFPLLPAAFAQFAFVAIGKGREARTFLRASWLVAAVFGGLSLTPYGIVAGVWRYPWGFYPRYGPLGAPFLVFFGVLGGLSLYAFLRTIRQLPRSRQRRRLVQFALGYSAGFVGIIDFLPAYGIPILPFGHVVALATVVVVGRAIRKYQLFDITPAFVAENIVFTIPDALIVCDDEGWIRIANEAACELTGYGRTELMGAPLTRLIDAPRAGDTELRPRDGEPIPVSIAVSSLMDGERRAGDVVVLRDLRERRRTEAEIRRQEVLLRTEEMRRTAELEYRTLVESMNEGIIHFDAGEVVLYINERAAAMLGLRREEAIGQTIAGFVGGELLDALLERAARGGQRDSDRNEVALPTGDGSLRWLEIGHSRVCDVNGDVTGSICILADITERRLAQQLIAASAVQWQATFDAIEMPVVIVDRQGVVQRANRAARGQVGNDGGGRPVHDLGPEQLWETVDRLARTATGTQRVQVEDAATGTTWDLIVNLLPADDGPPQIVATARDVSALVQLQQSLRRNETMAALGALVGGVAHEVRNPLFAISSTLDAFTDRYAHRPEYRQFSSVMRTQIARVSGLMSGLLELGRPPSTSFARRAIRPLLDEAIALCVDDATAAGVTIVCRAPDEVVVDVDERRLLQAFRNVIHNAVQHSPLQGTVTIAVEMVNETGGACWIRCTVTDQGTGFEQEDLLKVFEPFFTRRKGGTGLGLSIANAVLDQHHGRIHAANREQGGGIVSIDLPVPPKESREPNGRGAG
jgi:PAS domain S-box-containing protein